MTVGAVLALVLGACSTTPGFVRPDAETDLDATLDAPTIREAAAEDAGPLLGRVCSRAADCDDGIACTDDVCGGDRRCVNLPLAARCDDGRYCNGQEICDGRRGCIRGEAVTCDDGQVCTLDRCVETTRACEHTPLDRDGDGDPDDHCADRSCGDAGVLEPDAGVTTSCWRGHDCDDSNPRQNTLVPEICGDGVDNNCNGATDNAEPGGCRRAAHDRCDDPLDVSAGGSFRMELPSALSDYTYRCTVALAHDMVARLVLTEPHDVTIGADNGAGLTALQFTTACGSPPATGMVDCSATYPPRIRKRSLPAGEYFILVGTSGALPVDLTVQIDPATPAAPNESCAAPTVIPTDTGAVTIRGDLADTRDDVLTRCGSSARDLLYTFTLDRPTDVTLQLAGGRSDYFFLSLLRTCASSPDTLRCDMGATVAFTHHALPAGTYFVAVEAWEPIPFTLQASFAAGSPPPAGDLCDDPIPLTENVRASLDTSACQNDYRPSCGYVGRDGALAFTLTEPRDVLVEARSSLRAYLAVAIATSCAPTVAERACGNGSTALVPGLGLDPGRYFTIVKSPSGGSVDVTYRTFPPATPQMLDASNDTCMAPRVIPVAHGVYRGTTAGLRNDYAYQCNGFVASAGPDAAFRFHTDAPKRFIAFTDTPFQNVVYVTAAASGCPGVAPAGATGTTCSFGFRSTLNTVLPAGDYLLVVDGANTSDGGTYTLQTFFLDP